MIQQTDFFGTRISRLVLGDNPINGHTYIPDVYSSDAMLDYYTAANSVQALFEAEQCGINTIVPLANDFMLRVIREYRNAGGKMNIVFQPYPAIPLEINLRMMMQAEPIAIYHQGTTTDNLCESDRTDTLRANLEKIRACGVPVGLGTHVPETILRAEKEDWGVDFYMACLYNARRDNRGEESGFITGKSKHLQFYPEDRFKMFETARNVSKPFIVFKILAGGQIFHDHPKDDQPELIRRAFTEAYNDIKPSDVACIGVYQKLKNQIQENAKIVESILEHI
jgi:hypothetical protein